MSSSSLSSSSTPPVVPPHCSTVSGLYELLKCEEEPCRVWLRHEMNQIPEPLIDSLFHGLICSSSSSAVPQSRQTVSELCQQLQGEMGQLRMVLRGEMDRLVNTLTERLTNKLRMTNLDDLDREEDGGGDRAQLGQVEQPTPQPSTSTFNPVAHPQHSNGDEVQLNTVEMIEIKEEVEDGEETRIIDMETLTQDRQVKREIEQEENEMTLHNDQIGDWVKREIKEEEEDGEMVEVKEEIKEEDEEEEEDGEMVEVKEEDEEEEEDGEMMEVKEEIKEEDEEEEDGEAQINDIEGWAEDNQGGDDECQALDNVPLNTTLTHPTGQSQLTVTQSADLLSPQTSTAQDESSPTALNQQTTVPTQHNKRKQQTSNRSVKRSKITIQEDEGEDGEDIADDDREEAKVKILHLNCTQSNCKDKLDSMVHLHDHFRTVHRLSPFQCFAANCNARFDSPQQISAHIKLSHSHNTRFLCSVCPKERASQQKAYIHWYQNHLTGQFQCNLVRDCAQVTDTRAKMTTHHQTKHHSQSKPFHCTKPGCTAAFTFQSQFQQHQLNHLDTNQFHCNWPHCIKQFKLRGNLVQHIRMKHFGLPQSVKEQKEKNIVDLRDPNEYVRVVVDE